MQARQQPARGEIARRVDDNAAGLAEGFEAAIAVFELFERLADAALVLAPRIGKPDGAAMADEQRLADPLFEEPHFMADGGLGEAQFLRRPAETAKPGCRLEA